MVASKREILISVSGLLLASKRKLFIFIADFKLGTLMVALFKTALLILNGLPNITKIIFGWSSAIFLLTFKLLIINLLI